MSVKLLQRYGIFLTSSNLTCTRMKNTPQSCNNSAHQRTLQKPSTPQSVKWGRGPGITSTYAKTQDCSILSIPAPMMQHSLRTTFQQKLHHAGISSSICFTNQFTRPCMMQVPNGSHLRTYFSIKIITTPQYSKTPLCPDHPQVQDKFGIEDDNDTKKSPQTRA